MYNILLIGSNGFLGSHIYKELIESNNNIKTLNRNSSDYNYDLSNNIPFFQENMDIVIHCAGLAHFIPKNFIEEKKFYDINVNGTLNLLKGIERSKSIPKEIVFISSVAVYGQEIGNNIDENYPLLAQDPYGLSKIQAEKHILEWCKINNVICTILRLPLLVSKNPPGNLGAMIRGIKKGYYFNVAGGSAKKSMVLAENVAQNILKISKIGGIYNLTDSKHPTFSELSFHIAIQLGKRKPMNLPNCLAKFIAKIGDLIGKKAPLNTKKLIKITSDLTFDDSKARETFGWDPTPVIVGFKLIN